MAGEDTLDPEYSDKDGRILDGFLLLASAGSATPDGVVSASLSSLELVDVVDEDLTFFGHLDRLDLSDNRFTSDRVLQQLGNAPRLTRLSLACNSLSFVHCSSGTLAQLQSLDLSFNSLQGEVLSQLVHLKNLQYLNLSSNCISLVPEEKEIAGLESLEELLLDNNDLVQFVQWRGLDALRRLKKLSLAHNRIKRLKDDLSEFEYGDDMFYFRSLEELDLGHNEIASVAQLPALRQFRRLRKLKLHENPCMLREASVELKGEEMESFPGIGIFAKNKKQWYLCGNGCFQLRPKPEEPKLKMNRKRMHKVSSAPLLLPRKSASRMSMGTSFEFEDEVSCFLTSLSGGASISAASIQSQQQCQSRVKQLKDQLQQQEEEQLRQQLQQQQGSRHGSRQGSKASRAGGGSLLSAGPSLQEGLKHQGSCPVLPPRPGSPDTLVMDEGLSEQELEELLRERRQNIDSKFEEVVPEPPSFMRQVPFDNKDKRLNKRQATIDDRQHGEDSPASVARSEGRVSRSQGSALGSNRPSLVSSALEDAAGQQALSLARQSSIQFSGGSNAGSVQSPNAGLHNTLGTLGSVHYRSVDGLAGTLGADTSDRNRATVEAAWTAALEAANNGTMVLPSGQSTTGGRRRQSLLSNSSEGAGGQDSPTNELDDPRRKKSEAASRTSQITLPPVPRGSRKEAQASAGVRDALRALRAAALSEYSATPAY